MHCKNRGETDSILNQVPVKLVSAWLGYTLPDILKGMKMVSFVSGWMMACKTVSKQPR